MRGFRLDHLGNAALIERLTSLVAQERSTMASLLAHLGEVEARRLFAPAGYSSMYDYCMGEFRWTRQTTLKRIGAARTARRHPRIFEAIADGRLHVSAVLLLRPYLSLCDPEELLASAETKSKAEIEELLARRFPKHDVATRIELVVEPASQETMGGSSRVDSPGSQAWTAVPTAPQWTSPARATLKPLAPERYALQVTIDGKSLELLRRAQDLLSHQLPSGDVASVLARALETLVRRLESRKFAEVGRPRRDRGEPGNRRVSAHVRREVKRRDGGRCTFVGESGHRCESTRFLEYDHVVPVARGGASTFDNVRLRCRTHNQLEAERSFGAGFMEGKRCGVRRSVPGGIEAGAVFSGLRELGFRAGEARLAAQYSSTLENMTIEQRLRAAIQYLCPKAPSRAASSG